MSIGIHVSKKFGNNKSKPLDQAVKLAIEYLQSYGFNKLSLQVFTSGPQSYVETMTQVDKTNLGKLISNGGHRLVIHGAYVDAPWNKPLPACTNIRTELKTAATVGATGVIVHLGAGAAIDANLEAALMEIAKVDLDTKSKTILWLEINAAKSSPGTYETPEKLRAVFKRAAKYAAGQPLGLCIDSAHLFSCGVSLAGRTTTEQWLAGLPDVPIMLHLNDSASTLGSGVDKHEALCCGKIWKDYHPTDGILPFEDSGLAALLGWAVANDITVILERDAAGCDHDLALLSQFSYF